MKRTKWFKEKGIQAVRGACRVNIQLNTKTLISVVNRIESKMVSGGSMNNNADASEIMRATQSLLDDIRLGISNGMDIDDIEITIIKPIVDESQMGPFAKQILKDATDFIRTERRSGK